MFGQIGNQITNLSKSDIDLNALFLEHGSCYSFAAAKFYRRQIICTNT